MGEAVEQGSGHLGISKDRGPFAEAEVGCDRHAGALVELAQQMEQKRPARGAEGQISKFIQDHEVELGQALGDLPCLALGFFLFEGVDQFDGGEEPDLSAVMLDGLDTEGGGNMGHPLGLTLFDEVWLLTAWCETAEGFRNFRLDRIETMEETGARFRQVAKQRFQDNLASL